MNRRKKILETEFDLRSQEIRYQKSFIEFIHDCKETKIFLHFAKKFQFYEIQ